MDWTDTRITTLTKLWQEGLSASQVARQLGGISRSAVIGKLHRLGIANRPTPVRFRAPAPRSHDRASPNVRAFGHGQVKRPGRPAGPRTVDPRLSSTATLQTLTPDSCRWPIGDPRDSDFGYCGRTRLEGGSYCQCHAQVAFRGGASSKQSAVRSLERYVSGPRMAAVGE